MQPFWGHPRRKRTCYGVLLFLHCFKSLLLGFLWRRWVDQFQIIHFNDRIVVCGSQVITDKTALSGQSYSNIVLNVRLTRTTFLSLIIFLCFYKCFFLKPNARSYLLRTLSREDITSVSLFLDLMMDELAFQGGLMSADSNTFPSFSSFGWMKTDRHTGCTVNNGNIHKDKKQPNV